MGTLGRVTGTPNFNLFRDGLPDRLLDLDDLELLEELERPTLIRVPGGGEQAPRAVGTLLHGDEDTGYRAILRILRRRVELPFDLYVIVGNVRAALAESGFGHRFLDQQEDFNRVWGLEPTTRLRLAAAGILGELREAKIGALVDIHNNSGANPYYAIVTRIREDCINLATTFTTTVLHWQLDVATLMEAMSDVCPAIAVECGLAGRQESLAFAVDGLRRFLGAEDFASDRFERDFDLYGGLRKVVVRPEVRFSFGGELGEDLDFVVDQDADRYNFHTVPGGHVLGRVPEGSASPLIVYRSATEEVTEDYLTVEDGYVILTREVTPVMMTRTPEAARKDCLFYIASAQEPTAAS